LLAQTRGPIVYYEAEPGGGEEEKRRQTHAHDMRERDRGGRPGGRGEEDDGECGNDAAQVWSWSWRNLMNRSVGLGGRNSAEENKKGSAPEAYNLYDHDPDFRNTYGWTVAIDKHDYEPLKHSDIGVYLVNLTAVQALMKRLLPIFTRLRTAFVCGF
jgi:hypothetical protein